MGFCDRIWHYGRSLLICILRLSNYYAMFLSTKSDVKEKSKEPFTFRGIISLIINNARLHRRNLCRNILIIGFMYSFIRIEYRLSQRRFDRFDTAELFHGFLNLLF